MNSRRAANGKSSFRVFYRVPADEALKPGSPHTDEIGSLLRRCRHFRVSSRRVRFLAQIFLLTSFPRV